MKKVNNQGGYALLIVLLIITVIGIFTPIIISNLMNSSVQYQKTEKEIQLRNVVDMGVIYTEKAIRNAAEDLEGNDNLNSNNMIEEYILRLEFYLNTPSSDWLFTIEPLINQTSPQTIELTYTIIPFWEGESMEGQNFTTEIDLNIIDSTP